MGDPSRLGTAGTPTEAGLMLPKHTCGPSAGFELPCWRNLRWEEAGPLLTPSTPAAHSYLCAQDLSPKTSPTVEGLGEQVNGGSPDGRWGLCLLFCFTGGQKVYSPCFLSNLLKNFIQTLKFEWGREYLRGKYICLLSKVKNHSFFVHLDKGCQM